VLGFALSTLWEWLYFRRIRLGHSQTEEQAEARTRAWIAADNGEYGAGQASRLAHNERPTAHYQSQNYQSHGVLLENEQNTDQLFVADLPLVTPARPIATTPIVATLVVPQPVATAPIVTEPVVTAPIATAPIVTEPVVTKPVVRKPRVRKPVVTERIVTERVVTASPQPAQTVITPVMTGPVVPAQPLLTIQTNPPADNEPTINSIQDNI
jgi:hypothetical protein